MNLGWGENFLGKGFTENNQTTIIQQSEPFHLVALVDFSATALVGFSPMQKSVLRPRTKIMPSEIAGVAIKTSPMSFFESTSYFSPALMTKITPSSLDR